MRLTASCRTEVMHPGGLIWWNCGLSLYFFPMCFGGVSREILTDFADTNRRILSWISPIFCCSSRCAMPCGCSLVHFLYSHLNRYLPKHHSYGISSRETWRRVQKQYRRCSAVSCRLSLLCIFIFFLGFCALLSGKKKFCNFFLLSRKQVFGLKA